MPRSHEEALAEQDPPKEIAPGAEIAVRLSPQEVPNRAQGLSLRQLSRLDVLTKAVVEITNDEEFINAIENVSIEVYNTEHVRDGAAVMSLRSGKQKGSGEGGGGNDEEDTAPCVDAVVSVVLDVAVRTSVIKANAGPKAKKQKKADIIPTFMTIQVGHSVVKKNESTSVMLSKQGSLVEFPNVAISPSIVDSDDGFTGGPTLNWFRATVLRRLLLLSEGGDGDNSAIAAKDILSTIAKESKMFIHTTFIGLINVAECTNTDHLRKGITEGKNKDFAGGSKTTTIVTMRFSFGHNTPPSTNTALVTKAYIEGLE